MAHQKGQILQYRMCHLVFSVVFFKVQRQIMVIHYATGKEHRITT